MIQQDIWLWGFAYPRYLLTLELDPVAPSNVTLALADEPQKPTSAAHLLAPIQSGTTHESAFSEGTAVLTPPPLL
jgi:hypothetical protein